MRHILLGLAAIILCGSPLFLAGCAGLGKGTEKASKFYVLDSLLQSETAGQLPTGREGVAVGVGPLKFPELLDRPQIVTRTTRNEVKLAEFQRWAEPLDVNFASTLAENLSLLLSSDRVAVFPWRRSISAVARGRRWPMPSAPWPFAERLRWESLPPWAWPLRLVRPCGNTPGTRRVSARRSNLRPKAYSIPGRPPITFPGHWQRWRRSGHGTI